MSCVRICTSLSLSLAVSCVCVWSGAAANISISMRAGCRGGVITWLSRGDVAPPDYRLYVFLFRRSATTKILQDIWPSAHRREMSGQPADQQKVQNSRF
jgi:hypothetical protein